MIVFFVGTPGSGKSYEAVKKICDNLKMGRTVCTNIDGMDDPVCQEYMKALLDIDDFTFKHRFIFLSQDDVKQFWKTRSVTRTQYLPDGTEDVIKAQELICPFGSLIVIDEAHKHFNCQDWRKEENRGLADWASTHRHDGYDLVMLTQNIGKVEAQVRSLTEWCYFFRKVNFLGGAVQKKYLCYSYSGDDHSGTPLAKNVRTYDPKFFRCYHSYSTKDAKEVGFMTHVNVLKHPIFYAIPVVLLFCGWMFSKSSLASGDLFGTEKKLKQTQQQIDASRKQSASAPAAIPSPSPVPGIQKPLSSQLGPVPASLPPVPSVPSWRTYPVQAYISIGSQTHYMIHGVTFKHTQCRNYDDMTKTVECFGPDLQPPKIISAPAPAISSGHVPGEKSSTPAWTGAGPIVEHKSVHLSDHKQSVVMR